MENVFFSFKNQSFPISPQKMQLVASIIRRKRLDQVLRILNFGNNKSSFLFRKLLKGVINSLVKENKDLNDFYLSRLEVNRGPILKRREIRARWKSNVIRKRSSLVTCVVSQISNPVNQ